jgi:hypothetical protein
VLAAAGHIPSEGETVDVDGHLLVAEKVEGRRIGSVRIVTATGVPHRLVGGDRAGSVDTTAAASGDPSAAGPGETGTSGRDGTAP